MSTRSPLATGLSGSSMDPHATQSSILDDPVAHPKIESGSGIGNYISINYAGGSSRGDGRDLSKEKLVTLGSKYVPVPKTNSSQKYQEQKQQEASSQSDGRINTMVTSRHRSSAASSSSGVSSSSWRDHQSHIGTYSVATFKEGREHTSIVPTRLSGSSGKVSSAAALASATSKNSVRKELGNVANGHNKSGNSNGRRNRRRSSIKTNQLSSAIDSDDDDKWMEEALLHGISTANKKGGVTYQPATARSTARDDHANHNGSATITAVASAAATATTVAEMDQKRKFIKSQLLSALVATPPSTQQQQQQQSRLPSRQPSGGVSSLMQAPGRKTRSISRFLVPDLTKPEFSIEDILRNHQTINGARRMDEKKNDYSPGQFSSHHTSTFPSPYSRHSEQLRHHHESDDSKNSMPLFPPPMSSTTHAHPKDNDFFAAPFASSFSNKNIPTLPIINTYRLMKKRPDEPVGLFLAKAKNGAVEVHSLSPESPFLRLSPDPLSPGQEILSVNEKRINDPKMAARIITHAKKHLSLRVSTVKRGKGFMYCQVKRRNNGGDAEETIGDGVVAAASTGTHPTSETAGRATVSRLSTRPLARVTGVGQQTGTSTSTGPFHPGVRFVTTSVDGVRRGTLTEGLVRVSHIDPHGLFASSNPMNIRVGGIVLTVNGTPVTNGRAALDKVMGSRHLIEILHCDERVWRDAWVKDGMKQVLFGSSTLESGVSSLFDSGGKMEHHWGGAKVSSSSNSADDDKDKPPSNTKSSLMWDLEWQAESKEVILRHKRAEVGHGDVSDTPNYAFRLVFNNDVGTCHSELVDDITMMPLSDEFNVSLLVQMVNHSQRTMMTVLQDMLRNANFELFGNSGPFPDSSLQHAAAASGAPLHGPSSSYLQLQSDSRCDVAASNNLDSHRQTSSNIRRSIRKKQEKNNSNDIMMELCKGEYGGVDEELSQLANDLSRMDSRDRFKSSERLAINLEKGTTTRIPRRGSEGFSHVVVARRGSEGFSHAVAALSPSDIEQWSAEQWENKPTTSKIREFSARQHKMDVNFPSSDANSRLSGFSLFSADMLEYLEDAENVNVMYDTNSVSSREETDSPCTIIPQSPQDDDNGWEDGAILSSPSQESTENYYKNEPPPTEKNGEDEIAFVTGVFRDVASKYEIIDTVVGSGGFGEVRECYDKKTRKTYVVKSILKPEITDTTKVDLIRNEILLLHEAHHPNIVELQDLFEDDKYVHIVMERCTGGDLFDRDVSENPRQLRSHAEAVKYETRTAHVMRSILHVLKYLHSKFIVHRDIKPEHFLLTTDKRENQKIKLIDFGLARKHKPGTAPMKTFTGSPSFVAPEVIARKYDNMCDMFSVGVTAYFLLTGMLPFDGPTDQETFDLISVGKFKFPSSLFLSDDAKDFITKLLVVDPKKRLSAGKALNHPWLLRAASC